MEVGNETSTLRCRVQDSSFSFLTVFFTFSNVSFFNVTLFCGFSPRILCFFNHLLISCFPSSFSFFLTALLFLFFVNRSFFCKIFLSSCHFQSRPWFSSTNCQALSSLKWGFYPLTLGLLFFSSFSGVQAHEFLGYLIS